MKYVKVFVNECEKENADMKLIFEKIEKACF
jgi:hypothetical protein